ncbi:MAG: outer membrane beta-barrel protein, partial [Janthinobacterium lividum]
MGITQHKQLRSDNIPVCNHYAGRDGHAPIASKNVAEMINLKDAAAVPPMINPLHRRSSTKTVSIYGFSVISLLRLRRIPWLGSALLTIMSLPAYAQVVNLNFPPIATGYDQEIDTTVQARPHTLYAPLGIRFRAFEIYPAADQLFGYNSNPTASSTAHGSAFSRTAVSVSASSDWSRNSLGGEVGLDQYEYFSVASAHYTDWHVGIQGGYTIADEQLTLGYSHQSYHQL